MSEDQFVLRGSLDQTDLPDLLRSLLHDKETGELNISFLESRKSLFFRDGEIIFASSNNPDDRLGEYLVRRGKISVSQYLESAKLIRPGKRQGAILYELGYLSPEDMVRSLKGQVRSIVYSLFRWERGTYAMELKDLDLNDIVPLQMTTEAMILKGVCRISSWKRVLSGVGGHGVILRKSDQSDAMLYRLRLKEDETHLHALIDGRTPVSELCAMSYMTDFETYRMLWAFRSIGLIVSVDMPDMRFLENEERIETLIQTFEGIFNYIHSRLSEELGPRTRDLLSQSLKNVELHYPDLYRNVYVDPSGKFDFGEFRTNLFTCVTVKRFTVSMTALNELLYSLMFVVKRELGNDAERMVSERVKEMKQDVA